MAQLQKVQRTNKPRQFVLLARFLFFAATISATATIVVFAQQHAQIDPPVTNASTRTDLNQKETTNMNQLSTAAATKTAADAIRPFRVNFPEAELVELRRRIAATRW